MASASGTAAVAGSLSLYELLRPAEPPKAAEADKVRSLRAMLDRADQGLFENGGQEGRDVAQYWLKRALALQLGRDDMRWALTQLGTLYAQSGNSPSDYQAALQFFEMSAAFGDKLAPCFIKRILDRNLVTTSPERMQAWEVRAQEVGSCG